MSKSTPFSRRGRGDLSLRWRPLLRALCLEPGTIRFGVATADDAITFCVVARKGSGDIPLVWGTGIPAVLRLLIPAIAHADMGPVPQRVVFEPLGSEDPDRWIDRNEARIVPQGFTAERIVNEYAVDGPVIISVSVEMQAFARRVEALEREVTLTALLPSLQGLAWAYRAACDSPWILWKVDRNGSVYAKIDRGSVIDLCHFWAGSAALASDTATVLPAAGELLESIGGSERPLPVMFWTMEDGPRPPGDFFTNMRQLPVPEIKGLPRGFHEAYGNAITPDGRVQLLPFEKRRAAQKEFRLWHMSLTVFRVATIGLIALAAIAGSSIAVSRFLVARDRTAMKSIDEAYAAVTGARRTLDSLGILFREKSELIAGESAVTRLLCDLQRAFPEGVRAEELVIDERAADTWGFAVRAFTVSSALMQPFLANLQAIPGMRDVRLVYSEQVAAKEKNPGIRFKIEAEWR